MSTAILGPARCTAAEAAAERAETRFVLEEAIPTLRQWATDADNITVTSQNAVNVLGLVVDHLAIFFDRFADLLEMQYGN